ncbi:unnamed protein product [Eruca vesicaria subsp. sativa]|uniref:Legume lectin domain-containing protein n=1 Tax=Eruca vesicaria subsp. sativa TaxID=29727 RepID=A0ABC8ITK3_ERUVS|nr:unnamed protein product [Eruca vesicaria subsp. sativa]
MKNSILFLLSSFSLLLPFASSLNFSISHFSLGDSRIAYQGDATPNGEIVLNNIAFSGRVGWATYAKRFAIWDSKTRKASDFTTNFTFKIDINTLLYGHGLAFFLGPPGFIIPPCSSAGFLGLFNETNGHSSRFPLVHIEFDTFYNVEWDPYGIKSHVGINNNSLASSNFTSWNATLHSQDICHVQISYNAVQRNLSVSWRYEETSIPSESSSIYYIIDLVKVLPAEVTMGFSGATGSVMEGHRILSWDFYSSLDVIEKTKPNRSIILGASLSGFLLLASLAVVVPLCLKRKRREGKAARRRENLTSINEEDLERGAVPRRFSYKDLATATNNFLSERKLGQGVEIVTEKKSVSLRHGKIEPELSLVEKVWDLYGRGELMSAVDQQMGKDYDMEQAERLMIVGLWCAHPDSNSRPCIKQAIQVLNFEAPLPNLPKKMPVATYHAVAESTSCSSGVATATFSSAQLGR